MDWKNIFLISFLIFVSGCINQNQFANQTFEEYNYTERYNQTERFYDPYAFLPECSNQKFTVSPVDVNDITYIIPLGNLNPPEHTLPTEHMYPQLTSTGIDIKSPGDIKILRVQTTKYLAEGREDYGLTFALCKDVYGYFLHIKSLSPEIKSQITNEICHETYGDGKYQSCSAEVNIELKAGEMIGKVGDSTQTNFDFGAYNYRTMLSYVNPSRYSSDRSLNIVCPIELFESDIKSELYNKVNRRIEPKCGTPMQDVKGTLQGNWFYGDSASFSDWTKHLAFVRDNKDPSTSVISIGGVFTQAGRWEFTENNQGSVNRKFNDVKPDGNIYCYYGNNGQIIVQLLSETELKIEKQSGSCNRNFLFTNPTVYNR